VIGLVGVLGGTTHPVVTRSATMRLHEIDFVAAAKAIWASRRQILVREILPNFVPQILVRFTFELGGAILAESAPRFLDVGIQPLTPSRGPDDRLTEGGRVLPSLAGGSARDRERPAGGGGESDRRRAARHHRAGREELTWLGRFLRSTSCP
jgi:hypothetical protein